MTKQSSIIDLQRPAVAADSDSSGAAAVPRPPMRWKTRVLLPGAIVLAVVGLLAYSAGDFFRSAVAVEVSAVVVRDVGNQAGGEAGGEVTAQAPGWVEPLPFAVSVPALTDGVVEEMLVLEGQAVESGQIVARLIDDDARIALSRAEALLAQRKTELAEAQVAAGSAGKESADTLAISAELAKSPEAAALAEARLEHKRIDPKIAASKARLTELRTELSAKSKAASDGVISAVPVALLEARVAAQRAEIRGLEIQREILASRVKQVEVRAAAELGKARAAAQGAQAAVDEARLRLNRMAVRSPVAGVVMTRSAEPGMSVTAGASARPLVRLYDPNRLQVRVDVPLSSAARVGAGLRAEIVVDVLPDQVFAGRVLRIVNEADIERNTLQFKVGIDSPSALLKPEMLARVRFLAPPRKTAGTPGTGSREKVFAPVSAVGSQPGKTVDVWVADLTRGAAIRREVTLGTVRMGDWIEVRTGLNPGDRIIVAAAGTLADGCRIRLSGGIANVTD